MVRRLRSLPYTEMGYATLDSHRELRQGVPGEFGSVDVGWFINPPQAEIVKSHVEDAVKKGARVLAGGHGVDAPGSFFEPTVIA